MHLGAFSISLSVRDLAASRAFYEALGFASIGGNPDHGYLILKNGDAVIGLFHAMFEGNLLTFNPGWNQSGETLDDYEDISAIVARLRAAGIEVADGEAAEHGPSSATLTDPDGNVILIDQHAPRK